MPELLDPLATAERIESDYRSYLTSTFGPARPDLLRDFEAALSEPGRIRKGPFLQAAPPYRPGVSLGGLASEGVLHPRLATTIRAVPPERPLYVHQERALRRIRDGRNLVVATGTGSGKTETYLLPILDGLLRESDAGTLAQAGVRAMLLYPMNALANDQLHRLRDLLAPFPEITFGRYTGDTEQTPSKARERYRQQFGDDPPHGELIDREAIQATPPHILLTNFAMLEYLLLRPRDSTIFDGPTGRHWRWIVLDEVHVYDGAKGAEVAMLLRRVRDRVHSSRRGVLRCIGTSATLGRGEADSVCVARFAEQLFDEPFAPEDVVHPDRLPLRQGADSWGITERQLLALHGAWRATTTTDDSALGKLQQVMPRPLSARTLHEALWELLHHERHVIELQRRLEAGSHSVDELADIFATHREPMQDLTRLVDLCMAARPGPNAATLLPARYHLWMRASEGSYACLHPRHPEGVHRVVLDRAEMCAACTSAGWPARLFEIATCRHCRATYLVGLAAQGVLELAPSYERRLDHLLLGELDPAATADDEDESAFEDDKEVAIERAVLCTACGALGGAAGACACGPEALIAVARAGNAGRRELTRCARCGRRSNSGVVMRFLSGSEAPVAVLSTSLYQSLPEPDRQAQARQVPSGGGRKLLMFADSRQDAAFFAPYFQRTYERALQRSLIWNALRGDADPALLKNLVTVVKKAAERCGVLDDDGASSDTEVRTWLVAEMLATDRRQSLDGVGLAEIAPRLPGAYEPPAALCEVGLTTPEALDVTRILLDTLRQAGAVLVPDDVDVQRDPHFYPRNATAWVRGVGAEKGVLAWNPSRGQNRRIDYLDKLAVRRGFAPDGQRLLTALWEEYTDPTGGLRKVLRSSSPPRLGTVFGIDAEWIEFRARGPAARPYRCSTCRQVWWRSVHGVCPTYLCRGTLAPLVDAEASGGNHYAELYERLAPIGLEVEEHTGQLRSTHAADVQKRFQDGVVNALSCSTTFELGVDLGDVQAVLLRNVPPTAANYVQRAGRAGRRLDTAALVVAFAQRRSHDLTYFRDPTAMVDGVVNAPVMAVDNEAIVRRHVHAMAFAQFERERVTAGHSTTERVADLVGTDEPTVAEHFRRWLAAKPTSLQAAVERVVPADVADAIGVATWGWAARLFEPDTDGFGAQLGLLIDGVKADRAELLSLEAEAAADRKYSRAEQIRRTVKALDERRTIDVLSQRGVLPKYGFPVDVVDLDVSRSDKASHVELSRDLRLGILEFAPGAQVIADKKVWRSIGLTVRPGRGLPEWAWGVCDGCGALRTQLVVGDSGHEALREPCDHCGGTAFQPNRRGQLVIPMFGFVGEYEGATRGDSRPPREGRLETFFASFEGEPPPPESVDLGGAPIEVRTSRRGWITVFNRGRLRTGFRYCASCGFASDEPPKRPRKGSAPKHQRPYSDRECQGWLRSVDLGHRYLTNVLELALPFARSSTSFETAAHSTLEALISAVPVTGIAPSDIGGSTSVGASGSRTVVLFDDVPGGAGHTRYLRDNLDTLVAAAIDRVGACDCGEETSCYGCLRSYRNQQYHDLLQRRAALDVLRAVVGRGGRG